MARPSHDLAAAERFWRDGLGLTVLWRSGEAEGDHALLALGWPGATFVDPDGYRLTLCRRDWP